MSDSFADLWNSAAPSKQATTAPQKLGSISSPTNQLQRPQNDIFSLLSPASASSSSRSTAPSPLTPSPKPTQKSSAKPSSSSHDAFSGLLEGSITGSSISKSNMTIAERAAEVERQKRERVVRDQGVTRKDTDAWAGLDSLAGPSSRGLSAKLNVEEEWVFGTSITLSSNTTGSDPTAQTPGTASEAPQNSSSSQQPQPLNVDDHDDWGLEVFSSKPASVAVSAPKPAGGQSIWDFQEFAPADSLQSADDIPRPKMDNLDDFDFGDREDGLLDDQSGDEDDILGDLNKPVQAIPQRSSQPNNVQQASRQRQSSSPPPHLVGQIVEMGFSVEQARTALAATDSGLDVQVALEMLLSNPANSSPRLPSPVEDERPPIRFPRRQQPPQSNTSAPVSQSSDGASQPPGITAAQLQDQADKLFSQASEIGLNVFNRANAFWNSSKEKMQKVYEERAAAAKSNTNRSGASNGRPKWMQEGLHDDDEDPTQNQRRSGRGFSEHRERESVDDTSPRRPAVVTEPQTRAPRPSRQTTEDLLGDSSSPSHYVSPFRRGRPKVATADPTPSSSQPKFTAPEIPSSPVLAQRKTVSASASEIEVSAKHKASGTEMYKLGRFAEAEVAYGAAISTLPESHLLRVPLHNNRALARLKIGEHSAAIEDCSTVIEIIGASYHPAREKKVDKKENGAEVDLADSLVKAWKRRAEAWEGKEKWEEARKDWEAIAAVEWAAPRAREEAIRGIGRCRQMVNSASASEQPKPPPRVNPPKVARPSVPRAPTPPSQALNKLREVTEAAEAEDQARYKLKDSVDARVMAWKGGKESNIRALIASLDSVLWPELGWTKVGMGDLVTPSQVKIRYTKAIAKLHPDKLNASNTTLEQRMIANGVFGALNDAWNAFKS